MATPPPDLVPTDPADVIQAVRYVLGFRLNGKARGRRDDDERDREAREIYEHLARSGYVVLRKARPVVGPGY